MRTKAIAYYRANSTMNGREDNLPPQQRLCRRTANKNGMRIVGEYLDFGKRGQGFDLMLRELERHADIKLVLVAEASTLAHSPIDRETMLLTLLQRGVHVITAAGDKLSDDPVKAPMREAALRFGQSEAVAAALRTLKAFKIGRQMAAARRASAQQAALARA